MRSVRYINADFRLCVSVVTSVSNSTRHTTRDCRKPVPLLSVSKTKVTEEQHKEQNDGLFHCGLFEFSPRPRSLCVPRTIRRRRIGPEAGHALEKLGHAIEYLTDEFVFHGKDIAPRNAQLEAVQLLMRINRQIYFACPEIPSLRDRLRSILHLHQV